jgi:putative transposase
MARPYRRTPGGYVYHVCNRGSRKGVLFESDDDYGAFVELVKEARSKRAMRISAYCLMRTHFHFLLWPVGDPDVPRFMQWLTATHAGRWHRQRGTEGTGAVYQSRYVSKPISEPRHYYSALRYVERNALAAGLVERAEDWRWGSAWRHHGRDAPFVIDQGPIARPSNWLSIINDL